MNSEFLPNENYPLDDIKIKTPKALQGGTYSAILEINSKPIIVQTPKCKTKKGIHKTSKQVYCDLLFLKDNTDNIVFINWLNSLQNKVRKLILENGDNWFHDKPSLDEVEYNWNDSIRTYKSNYNLIRTFIYKNKTVNKLNIQIYDDNENELHLESIDDEKSVISILEIKGLKFSSQSFHLEIFLRQIMILNEKPIFSKCLIKTNKSLVKKEEKITESTITNINNINDTEKELHNDVKSIDDINDINDHVDAINEDIDINDEKVIKSDTSDLNTNSKDVIDIKEESSNDLVNNNLFITEKNVSESNNNNLEKTEKNNINLEKNYKKKDIKNISETQEINKKIELTQDNDTLEKYVLEDNNQNTENELQEIDINVSDSESIKLKNATDVYLDIYTKAREKAKKARNEAIKAYLEVKRIKDLYMIDVIDSSDDEDTEENDEYDN